METEHGGRPGHGGRLGLGWRLGHGGGLGHGWRLDTERDWGMEGDRGQDKVGMREEDGCGGWQ